MLLLLRNGPTRDAVQVVGVSTVIDYFNYNYIANEKSVVQFKLSTLNTNHSFTQVALTRKDLTVCIYLKNNGICIFQPECVDPN